MVVTFRSKAYADIMMFGDIAVSLLKLMGHSGTVPGALQAEDVPTALEHLKTAIAAHKAVAHKATVEDESDSTRDDDSSDHPVDLAHRALPLIELLAAAAAAKCDVMWDQ